MHILITGGTGLIGSALCKALLAEGHRLTVLTHRPRLPRMRRLAPAFLLSCVMPGRRQRRQRSMRGLR